MRIMSIVGAIMVLAACGPTQSDECKKFVECNADYGKLEGVTATDYESTHGAKGTCWSSNAAAADACTKTCVDQLEVIKTAVGNMDGVDLPASCN